ncbi:TVP38/TMEM64 family protein [Paenibacillus sambharensis]|uniref:TVP38/TMEM64 family membrane protein n=1 Tax=Paenibacillus sambharensis TaxID=1803190 RepID=A0A2W1LD98_9BACL|nr:TVP38/TMEM64 family protein [Paenibacillus sambharensis]PZD96773.1 TVP38/TMEM64 family protein [Paenibacillus sambharensis]
MILSGIMSYFTEEQLKELLEQFRSLGPLPGILLTFMKSFVPPLPTIVIVGVNAAVYGLWLGFLYSWIGMVSGCVVTYYIVRRFSSHPYLVRWSRKPKVQKGMEWVRRNGFNYVFLFSIFPVGPFVIINVVAGLARMRARSYIIALLFGKGIMVFSVSFVGHDVGAYVENPFRLLYVALFIAASFVLSRKAETWFARRSGAADTDTGGTREAG